MSQKDSSNLEIIVSAHLYNHIAFGEKPSDHAYYIYEWRLVHITPDSLNQLAALTEEGLQDQRKEHEILHRDEEAKFLARFKLCNNYIVAYQHLRNRNV